MPFRVLDCVRPSAAVLTCLRHAYRADEAGRAGLLLAWGLWGVWLSSVVSAAGPLDR